MLRCSCFPDPLRLDRVMAIAKCLSGVLGCQSRPSEGYASGHHGRAEPHVALLAVTLIAEDPSLARAASIGEHVQAAAVREWRGATLPCGHLTRGEFVEHSLGHWRFSALGPRIGPSF